MDLSATAKNIEGRVLTATPAPVVNRVIASDRMSEILDRAGPETLLVSRLASDHLLRAAHLVDIPAVCVAGGTELPVELVKRAEQMGILLMASPLAPGEIIERLQSRLSAETRMWR